MKIYVVEDEFLHLEDLLITIHRLGYTCAGHSNDPFEAQEQIKTLRPDVVLIDIHLNGKQTGISLAEKIQIDCKIPVIFVTTDTSVETISNATDVTPAAYITKPVNENDLQAALILAGKKKLKKPLKEVIDEVFIKNGRKLIKLPIDSILYIYADTKNYCTIVTETKKLTLRSSIKSLGRQLDEDIFVQIHKGYIVNWKKIDSLNESSQRIEVKGHILPLGRAYKTVIYNRIKVFPPANK